MKFRLPFQIYRTGVISRSSSPGKILYKFSKDNEAKVRKKTSKINSSYRTIISNYIYSFTHLPLKVTMSKLRNRTKLRSSIKSHKTKIRNEFVFLQETLKDNSTHKKTRNVKATNDTSECCMNSIKCANFMCAKSTAKILLQQKDLLCNKTTDTEDEKLKENKQPKNVVTKPTKVEKEIKATNKTTPPPLKKIKKPIEMPIKEKHKPIECKLKYNKSETVASSTELKRLKRLLKNTDENRNYKKEECPPTPIRMDSVMGTPHYPKKLPELPIQIMPKVEQVRPKEGPSLVAPKRKYDAPEMTRNYKSIENIQHGPPRMDNLVGCKAEPKERLLDIKGSNENYTPIPAKPSVKKSNVVVEEKDAFLFKLDQVVNDLIPKTKKPTWSIQQLNKANINVSEKIKRFEELIGNTDPHIRSKPQGLESKFIEEKLLTQSKKIEKILSPKLSPFAIAEIRRKYYPSDTFEKEKIKLKIPVKAAPLVEKNVITTDTKLKHLYTRPKEQYKNLNENLLDINPSGNIKKKHAKNKNSLTCHSGVVKGKDILTIDVDNSKSDSFGDCSTCSTIDTSTINNIITPKVLIPPPSKAATAPENKRNYSSTAIYEYKEAFNGCTELLNSPSNLMKSNATATSNLYEKIPQIERMFFSNHKKAPSIERIFYTDTKYGETNSGVSIAKKRNKMESNNIQQVFDNLKQDRRFSSDVLTKNLEHNDKELDKSFMSNPNSNMPYTPQRNLSKRHCTIKVTSTLDNQDNVVSPEDGSNKTTRKLSYQYYHEQCSITKNVNDYEVTSINLPENEDSSATLVINTDDITNERYEKMLNDKKTLINNYIKWKMQLHKFGNPTKKCSKTSKCCINFMNKVYKQNKYKMRKYKIIHGKSKNISSGTLPVQKEQNESFNSTVNLIKSQVAHKCLLFDKISDALLKKTDIINYSNHSNKDVEQKEDKTKCLRNNNKRKLSRVPVLDNPPKKKMITVLETKKNRLAQEAKHANPVQEAKHVNVVPETKNANSIPEAKSFNLISEVKNIPVSEAKNVVQNQVTKIVIPAPVAKNVIPAPVAKNVIPAPVAKNIPIAEVKNVNLVPDTGDIIEHMDVDMPLLQATISAPSSRVRKEICNKRETISQISSAKNISLQHTIKIKPPAIPATLKAKKFLAKIEAEPKQLGNMLLKKIDKKVKHQKSVKFLTNDKIGKYIAYV